MKKLGLLGDTAADERSEKNPERALLELGNLLLEIWNLEAIESWASSRNCPPVPSTAD
jgi:hypothetical protein